MAEQLALKQGLRQGAAVDGDEGAVPTGAVVVDRAGDQFLARPAFPADQDGAGGLRHAADQGKDLLHNLAGPDEILERGLPL